MRNALAMMLGIALAAMPLLMGGPGVALACTPPPGGLPVKTVTDHVDAADITLVGTVVRIEGEPGFGQQQATIRVVAYVTSGGPAVVHVDGYGNGALCLSELSAGQHGLFYASRSGDGSLHAFYLTQFDAFAPASDANLAEAAAAAGHGPSAPDMETRLIANNVARGGQPTVEAAQAPRRAETGSHASITAMSLAIAGAIAGVGVMGLAGVQLLPAFSRAAAPAVSPSRAPSGRTGDAQGTPQPRAGRRCPPARRRE